MFPFGFVFEYIFAYQCIHLTIESEEKIKGESIEIGIAMTFFMPEIVEEITKKSISGVSHRSHEVPDLSRTTHSGNM